MNYYNEWDKGAAAWLRELIKAGLIPNGYVDDRSITDVTPSDLEGFTQCHFFAGIGGWSYALQLAGIPASVRLWTGSPPCQPFSVAGKQLGQLDERHLAPTFMRLVAQCRPPVLFGEQVAAAIGKHWLDALLIELEEQGYTCGAAVLPAASVGAPHKRDRLFFGAHRLAHAGSFSNNERYNDSALQRRPDETEQSRLGGSACRVADTDDTRPQGRGGMPERADQQPAGASGLAGGMGNPNNKRRQQQQNVAGGNGKRVDQAGREQEQPGETVSYIDNENRPANPHHGFWSDADWLGCRDGKFRPVGSGTFPLVDGFSVNLADMRAVEIQTLEEIINYASESKTDPGQVLRDVRQYLQSAKGGEKSATGMLFKLHEAEVLFSFLQCICAAPDAREFGGSLPKKNNAYGRGFLRSLRISPELGSSSCRWKSYEPRSSELTDPVLAVSLILARNVAAYRKATLGAHASSGRVAMLRGAGNAIVPQVAAEFIKAFTGAVVDVGN